MTHPKYSVWDDFFGDSVYKPTMTRGLFIDHWTGWGPNPKYGAAVAANTQPENMGCSKQTNMHGWFSDEVLDDDLDPQMGNIHTIILGMLWDSLTSTTCTPSFT